MQFRLAYAAGMSLVLLAGCTSQPTETEGNAALRGRISSSVGDTPFEVTSFQKTDGQSIEVMGTKGYRLFYTAMVSYPNGFKSNCLSKQTDAGSFMGNVFCASEFGGPGGGNPVGPQASGAVTTYSGQIDFQKTENRWLAEAVSLQQQSTFISPSARSEASNANESSSLKQNDWGDSGGYYIVFQTSSASDRSKASSVTLLWDDYLKRVGVTSYKIEWRAPDKIILCIQNNIDPLAIKQTIQANNPGAQPMSVVEERSFSGGNCGVPRT